MTVEERLQDPGQVKLCDAYTANRLAVLVIDSPRSLDSRMVLSDEILPRYIDSDSKDRTYFGDLWGLLEQQPTGEEDGELLTDGRSNFFQMWDNANYTWVIQLEFTGSCWLIRSFPAKDGCLLPTGSKMFFLA